MTAPDERFRDDDAELALLGAVVAVPDHHAIVSPRVVSDDFGNSAIGVAWAAAGALATLGRPITPTGLVGQLRAANALDVVQRAVNLGALPHMVATLVQAEDYARIVARNGRARRMLRAAHRAILAAADATDPEAYVTEALASLTDASTTTDLSDGVELFDLADAFFTRIVDGQRGASAGAHVGLSALDKKTNGVKDGQLVVIAARPAMGKSALAMQMATEIARSEGPVLVFSAEMQGAELWTRMVCAAASVDSSRVDANMLASDEYQSIEKAARDIVPLPIRIVDTADITPAAIRATALRHRSRHKTRLVVIDHLHCLKLRETGDKRSDATITGEASRQFKQLAKELGCPIILLAQLNRECEKRPDKRPVMSDLLDSGRIEADADAVWMLYRDDAYKRSTPLHGISEIGIQKQRGGTTGRVFIRFEREFTRFRDLNDDEQARVDSYLAPPQAGQSRGRRGYTQEQDDAAE